MVLAQKETHRTMEQNRDPRNKHMNLWSIYDKGGKNMQWRKDSLLKKWCCRSWITTCKSMKVKHSLTPYRETNSQWSNDQNVIHDTIKILEENTGQILFDINHNNIFLDLFLKTKEIKAKINKRHLIKLKSFCIAKQTINKTKRQAKEQEKKFANDVIDKGLIYKLYKKLIQLNINKTKKSNEKMGRRIDIFQEDIQMANRHMKSCSTSLIIREIQIKTTMRYHLTPVRTAIIK